MNLQKAILVFAAATLFFGTLFVLFFAQKGSEMHIEPKEPKEVVKSSQTQEIFASESSFDSLGAQRVGADEYGMKKYVMAFLKKGPNRDQDSVVAAKLQKAHMDNINRMAEAGFLVLAGPFMDDFETRGIYIFNVSTIDSAKKLTATDPAIKAGRLTMELHPWFGSAALMDVNSLHKKYSKKSF